MKQKKNILRICAALSGAVMLTTFTDWSVYAVSMLPSDTYTGDCFEIGYNVTNHWENHYQCEMTIRNTGNETIHDWCLAFASEQPYEQIWNCNAESLNGLTLLHNKGYNQDILPGELVQIGFIYSSENAEIPSKYELISDPSEVPADSYSTDLKVVNDWETGYTAAFTITNNTDKMLEDWILEFDWDHSIDTVWNAIITEHTGMHYTLSNASYNQNIEPGQTIEIYFQNSNSGGIETQPGNVMLYEYGTARRNAIDTLLNVRDVSMDLSSFDYSEQGFYYVSEAVDSFTGTIRPGLLAKSGSYSIENAWGMTLAEGTFIPNKKWTIADIGFVLGMNKVTVNVEFEDGTTATEIEWFQNLCEDNVRNIQIDESDPDGDGLSTYIEAIYGTDPMLIDTDGDGLTDYQELVEIGTNPLVQDSDSDGILDGRDDLDKDGLDTITEYEIGTDPMCVDTDDDDLNDYEEINTYHTDPLKKDTDGDGANDGWEISNGTDPLVKDDFSTVEQTVEGDTNTAEITVTAMDGSATTLTVKPLLNDPKLNPNIPGYMGSGFEFEMEGEFTSAVLKITFDESYLLEEDLLPVIYYYNEETGELEEIETEWDGVSNYVTATLPHFSKYILLNKRSVDAVYKEDILYPHGGSAVSAPFEFVFAIDSSASMGPKGYNNDPDNIRLAVSKNFVNNFSEKDKAAVLSFGEKIQVLSNFTNNKTVLKNAIDSVGNDENYTKIGAAIQKGLELFDQPNGSVRYMILLTDGKSSDSISSNYITIAKQKKVQIITIALGHATDTALLKQIAKNTDPKGGNGLYYFAASANELVSAFSDLERDVQDDSLKDSNNDGITDAQTKAFCDGTLTTFYGENPFRGMRYEDIQADTDGDLDGDGLLNGEEVHIPSPEADSHLLIYMITDPTNPDCDYDGINDGKEVKNGTNPNVFDIDVNDATYLTNNQQFLASSYSKDYENSYKLRFQLQSGNLITNFKWSYVRDYEIALCNYFSTSCKVLGSYNVYKEAYLALADDIKNRTSEITSDINDFVNYARVVQPAVNQAALYKVGYEWCDAVKDLADKWGKSLEAGILDDGLDYVEEFARINDVYGQRMAGFDMNLPKNFVPEHFRFSKKLEHIPVPFKGSEKVATAVKQANNVIEGAGYALIWVKGLADSYDTVASIATFASIDHEYDTSLTVLQSIIDYSNLDEMRKAAKNLKNTVSGERETFEDIWRPLTSSAVETGKTIGVGLAIKNCAKIGPWVWAVDLGISIGNALWHIGELDNEVLCCIALGNAAECLSKKLNTCMYADGADYYAVTDEGIDLINQLAQLRIYGEDQFKSTTSKYPFLIDLLYRIIGGDWLSTSTADAAESNKNCVMDLVNQSLLLYATTDYDDE